MKNLSKMLKPRQRVVSWILIPVIVFLSLSREAGLTVAQGERRVDWSRPVNLSNSPESSGRPAIVADDYGYVHAFWSEEVGGESILDTPRQLLHDGNTIFYTRWDGVAWTPPIDILFVPGESIAEYVAVTIDADNRLHAIWTGQASMYYSSALSWQAGSAHAWSDPVVITTDNARTPWAHSIVVDSQSIIHVVYAALGDKPGVYHISSQDGGVVWSWPTKVSAPFDRLEWSLSMVRVVTDSADRLHVVWQTNQEEGYGQAVYHARSTDGGVSWSTPVRMGYREPGEYDVSFPYLACVGESELHLIYIDGPWHVGRWHRISRDSGETWGEPSHIITNLEGVNGYTIPLVDGAGGLHLVTTMRTLDQVGAPIFYARWLGTRWTPTEMPFRSSEHVGPGAHWTAVTVRLGNEIHVLWNTNFTLHAGEVWHSRGRLTWMTPMPVSDIPAAETPVPTPTVALITPTPDRVPTGQSIDLETAPPVPSLSIGPLLVGAAPTLLLVAGAILWTRLRER